MIVKLTVTYDGTNYCGWQVQPNKITVQEVIEKALLTLTGEKIKVIGSGRTDAGVHAEGQVAHFKREKENIPPEKFALALNIILPDDVKIVKSERADDDFSARRSAKRKTYVYRTYVSTAILPLKDRYALQLEKQPDVSAMKECAKLIEGEHDFKAFCSSGTSVKTTVRTVYSIDIEERGNEIIFSVTGNGFLYNMVRIIVGTLLAVGRGKIGKKEVEDMLATGKRALGGKTIPAKGLTLLSVEY
ncbi:MAG: tRNA pseudouridine(38-40) synthase TruA [Clostridia bacterium]|nr:tRNA pseudouridine(38-40) synthase TruA [Clostridia bacterium]